MNWLHVGRDGELASVEDRLSHLDQTGTSISVRGEPGIGKSAFLSAVADRAAHRGLRILKISGVPSETQMPFAGLHQLVHALGNEAAGLPLPQRRALQAACGMASEPAVPDIYLVGLAALALISRAAAAHGAVLIVDDAHWLDQPSFEVIAFVSRRIRTERVCLIGAFRQDTSRTFGGEEALEVILAGLDENAATTVLATFFPGLPAGARQTFLREAAGNPLALIELPRAGMSSTTVSTWMPLTQRLEHAFFARASELPPATRMLLHVAAENDGPSLYEVMNAGAAILQRPVEYGEIMPAVAAGLVEIDVREIRFRHPLVRSAIRQAADFETRQAVHAALADVTRGQRDRHAWHRAAAVIEPDEGLACELDEVASRAGKRGGAQTALSALQHAIRLSSSSEGRLQRLLYAAELAVELGQQEKMEDFLREAESTMPGPADDARIALIRELSETGLVSDPSRVALLVEAAASARDAGEKTLALNLLSRAAQRCWWGDATTETRREIQRTAGNLAADEASPQVTSILGYASPLGNGDAVYRALQAYAKNSDLSAVTTRHLGSAANVIGAPELGLGLLMRSSAMAREEGRLGELPRTLFAQAWAQVEVGHWDEALAAAAEGVTLAEETGGRHWVAASKIVEARVAGMRGDMAAFIARSAEAERIALPLGASFLLAMLQLARTTTALGAGRPLEAFDHIQRMFDPADPAYNSSIQFYAASDLVEAAIAADRPEVAARVLADIETATHKKPVPWVRANIAYCKALVAPPELSDAAFDAANREDLKDWPFLRGRCLLAQGEYLRRNRRPAEARAPLRAAAQTFDALGAVPWSERAWNDLRAAGEGSRQGETPLAGVLSPQELQIARLAATGLTNKEIGLRLKLSHRTVGYHLHKIFPKTGVTARAELRDVVEMASFSSDT